MQTETWEKVLGRKHALHHILEGKPSRCYFCNYCSELLCVLCGAYTKQELVTTLLPSTSPAQKKTFLGVSFGKDWFLKKQSLCHCLHDILLQNEATWAYLCSTAWENRDVAGYTHLHPVLKAVGCLTSCHGGCLMNIFWGRELENTGNRSIKSTFISILYVLKLRLYYC